MSYMGTEDTTPTVSDYTLTNREGRHIRVATKVTFADGYEIRFVERLPKREAIRQAEAQRAREEGR